LEGVVESPVEINPSSNSAGRVLPVPTFKLIASIAPAETRMQRFAGVFIAICFTLMYAYLVFSYWAPAHPGVDQNAYLVGGKSLARTGSTAIEVADGFSFVGRMYVAAESGEIHPKYPLGLPILYASCVWMFGDAPGNHAYVAMHAISPAMSSFAVLGMFMAGRLVCGTFGGLLAMILLSTSQVMLLLSVNPNSHAAAICVVVWGMYFLCCWSMTGHARYGWPAGFLLGFATLVRYTDGLLALCIAVASIFTLVWRKRRSYIRVAVPSIAWWMVVGVLVAYNSYHFGSLTGYDGTNESSGFSMDYFWFSWDLMIRTIHETGLFFVMPLGVIGMILLSGSAKRLTTLLWVWGLPSILLYTSYYWAPQSQGTGYARFVLTQLPPLVIGASYALVTLSRSKGVSGRSATLAAGVVVAVAAGVSAYRVTGSVASDAGRSARLNLETTAAENWNLFAAGEALVQRVPSKSILFSQGDRLHHLQLVGDWSLYQVDGFRVENARRLLDRRGADDSEPHPIDPRRIASLEILYRDKKDPDLIKDMRTIIDNAFATRRQVFVFLPEREVSRFEKSFIEEKSGLTFKNIQTLVDSPQTLRWPDNQIDNPPRRPMGMGGPQNRPGPGNRPIPPAQATNRWILGEIVATPLS